MFGPIRNAAAAYANIGMETGVTSASPHQLIVMLYDGALIAVATALKHMKDGNVAAKGKSISHAISIIDSGLRASLNKEAGGEIAANLDALYEYVKNRLLIANLNNQPEILDEVYDLLGGLKEAWEAIGTNPKAAPAPPPPAARAYDPLAPSVSRLVKA